MPKAARQSVFLLVLCQIPASDSARAQENVIPFDSDQWTIASGEVVEHLGRTALRGAAALKNTVFDNGVIEVDIAVDGRRSYPGLVFRVQSDEQHEHFYLRPHRAGLYPDALQYAPVFNGVSCWQLYSGDGFTAPARFPTDRWFHLKLEAAGTQARVYLDEADQPALIIHDLKHGLSKGTLGVKGPADGTAYFSNFTFRPDHSLEFDPPPAINTTRGTIMEWEVTRPFPAGQVSTDRYPDFFQLFNAGWRPVVAEPSGLVNLSRLAASSPRAPRRILARTMLVSSRKRTARLSLGYSDNVTVFLNGAPVFAGVSGYRSRDPSFVGVIGYNDTLHLALQKGLNEIALLVSDAFGGWGFMARTEPRLPPPTRAHGRLTKVWETPADFRVPESALYDAARRVLYVSSFNRIGAGKDHAGFISRVTLDGRIDELEWITGLDGPCGMGLVEDTLYVAECTGHLVAIDIPTSTIRQRFQAPGAQFLNDVSVAPDGRVFFTNSSISPRASDVYVFEDGQCAVWKDGDELHRANGLFVHEDTLVVGNTGDEMLKSISLDTECVSPVVCLGAGIIDGIRADNDGNLIVSRWEGQAYLISPDGEIVEILDTQPAGENCADLEFVKDENLLVVPTFLANKVVAYRLNGR